MKVKKKTLSDLDTVLILCLQYKATDVVFDGPGKFQISWTPEGGSETKTEVFTFKNGGGCGMAMYNTDEVQKAEFKCKTQTFRSLKFIQSKED